MVIGWEKDPPGMRLRLFVNIFANWCCVVHTLYTCIWQHEFVKAKSPCESAVLCMKELNANILLNCNSLQLKSSGVSLTSSFPLRFSGSPQVAAFSVFGVFFSKVVSHKILHVQFRGFESSRLWKTQHVYRNSQFHFKFYFGKCWKANNTRRN